jgi:hypothetical protein
MNTATTPVKPAEVREKAKAVRKALGLSLALLDAHDIDGAYAAAEDAQHTAYDMKMLISEALPR